MLFINTRPSNRALPLTKALHNHGITVVNLPLLELKALTPSTQELNYQQNFINSHAFKKSYSALIVISPTAAKLGLKNVPIGFMPSCPAIAVGEATAVVLRKAGWQVFCPQESSNEGMMVMTQLKRLRAKDSVLVWRGRGGRRLLVNHLQDRGVVVDAIEWYQRQRPKSLVSEFKTFYTNLSDTTNRDCVKSSRPIVLISSGEAFNNWTLLIAEVEQSDLLMSAKQCYQLQDFHYLTFGTRLTNRLVDLNLKCTQLDSLAVEEVLRKLKNV